MPCRRDFLNLITSLHLINCCVLSDLFEFRPAVRPFDSVLSQSTFKSYFIHYLNYLLDIDLTIVNLSAFIGVFWMNFMNFPI